VIPVRRTIAGVVFFLGAFVVFFGLGQGVNVAVMVLGAALMVLAATLWLVNSLRGGVRRWVEGTGHVVEVTEPPPSSGYGRCELQLIVRAAGMAQEAVMIRDPRVPVEKWPYPGLDLPIEVAVNDIRNVRIQWDDVEPHGEPGDDWDDWDQPATVGAPRHDDTLDFHRDEPPPRPRSGPSPTARTATSGAAGGAAGAGAPGAAAGPGGAGFRPTMAAPPPEATDLPRRTSPPSPSPSSRATPDTPQPGATRVTTIPTQPGSGDAGTRTAEPAGVATATATAPPATAIYGVGITVLVADLPRSVAFYRDMLGFREVDGGETSTVLASGGTRVVLRSTREFGPVNRRVVHLNLEVDDVHAGYAELKSRGVRFTYAPRPVNRSATLELWAAAFKDPDGHGIAITQWRPREAPIVEYPETDLGPASLP
jgi:catechol 2,3-dioxygenase-like lactoylglutathione lyase family enzyme